MASRKHPLLEYERLIANPNAGSTLRAYERTFDRPRSQWRLAEWRGVAELLALRVDAIDYPSPTRTPDPSIAVLAILVDELRAGARYEGEKLTMRDAVREVHRDAVQRDGLAVKLTPTELDTLLREVRRRADGKFRAPGPAA